jgi:hypothetical protein
MFDNKLLLFIVPLMHLPHVGDSTLYQRSDKNISSPTLSDELQAILE